MPMGSREVGPGGGGCEGQQEASRGTLIVRPQQRPELFCGVRDAVRKISTALGFLSVSYILVFRRSTVEPGGLVKVFDIDNDSIFPLQVRRRSEVFK